MSTSQDEDSGAEDCGNDFGYDNCNGNDDHDERRPSQDGNQQNLPKAKRVACVLCRKRKLRCDGVRPACATCKRLQRDCVYDEVRRKSGPRRGYVKALEARLAQVETLLKTQDDTPLTEGSSDPAMAKSSKSSGADLATFNSDATSQDYLLQFDSAIRGTTGPSTTNLGGARARESGQQPNTNGQAGVSWEMVGLGLEEPLPLPDVVNELNQIYFDKIHSTLPMIHRPRYYAAMNLAPHMRPAICLRYAMWAAAATVSDKYEGLHDHFYFRSRKYIQQDEMKGHGEPMITIAHCQTWILLTHYEFKLMYFPRAWMSAGRACRMAQMMGTHRLDGAGLDVKQCLPPPKDLTDLEERRRTFWACFCVDRYSSIGTGWPMTIEEIDIATNLPVDEEAFEMGQSQPVVTLKEVFEPGGVPQLNPFSAVVLLAALFGRNLLHLHRPQPDDQENNLNGGFWRRHRHLDNILLNTSLALPDKLRLPMGMNNPNTIFTNMNIHTSTICLHQAAIFKADKNRMPSRIAGESKIRCITAAAEIASIMRQICHLDLSTLNPFVSFCLYVAARVFVQYLKSRPKDSQVHSSLQFLLTAMHAIKRKNPLTESFLVQLDVDLEAAGLEEHRNIRNNVTFHVRPPPTCPTQHLGMESIRSNDTRLPMPKFGRTYGDDGPARYCNPQDHSPNSYEDTSRVEMSSFETQNGDLGFGNVLNLPSRGRTPGSAPGSTSHHEAMDVSPDGSGDQNTPSSIQNLSSHTSNTAYSPPDITQSSSSTANQFQPHALYDNHDSFNTAYDIQNFPLPNANIRESGFILPPEWSQDSGILENITNLPPSGLTPEGSNANMMNDMLNLTDADWNEVMSSTAWDPTVFQEHVPMPEMLSISGRKRN